VYSTSIIAAVINGFGAALIWTAQGAYVTKCSNDENRGFFMGLFWFILMGSQIFGNLIAAFVLNSAPQSTFFIVMSCVALLGVFIFLLLGKPKKQEYLNAAEHLQNEDVVVDEKVEFMKDFKQKTKVSFQLLVSKQMFPLLPFMFFTGLVISYYAGVLPNLVSLSVVGSNSEKDSKSAYAMIVFGVGESLGGLSVGKLIDLKGRKFGLVLELVFCLTACVLAFIQAYVDTYTALCFFTALFWGFTDSAGGTAMNSILGTEFTLKVEPFAVNKIVQSIGAFVGFIVFAFFKDLDDIKIITGIMAALLVLTTLFAFTFKFGAVKMKALVQSEV